MTNLRFPHPVGLLSQYENCRLIRTSTWKKTRFMGIGSFSIHDFASRL